MGLHLDSLSRESFVRRKKHQVGRPIERPVAPVSRTPFVRRLPEHAVDGPAASARRGGLAVRASPAVAGDGPRAVVAPPAVALRPGPVACNCSHDTSRGYAAIVPAHAFGLVVTRSTAYCCRRPGANRWRGRGRQLAASHDTALNAPGSPSTTHRSGGPSGLECSAESLECGEHSSH